MIGATFLRDTGAVRVTMGRQSIEIAAGGTRSLISTLRTWPLGLKTLRLAGVTGSILIREWQAEAVANAIATAIEDPQPTPPGRLLAEPARLGERMSVSDQNARLAQLEAVPRAHLTLAERREFDLLDRRRDQRRRYLQDIAA